MARLHLTRGIELAMQPQTADRAKQILDRAAKWNKLRPGITHRRLFDKQLKNPAGKSSVKGTEWLQRSDLEYVGKKKVPVKSVKSEQPSVSVKKVKDKIDAIKAGKAPTPHVLEHNGEHHILDAGNHNMAAHRALGNHEVEVHIWRLKKSKGKGH